ncbi:hypothetical protein CkaCkLH20_04522 [Colletotrichum karsti]|uniref:Uncharacterized protein n=1 Tax=Colletotrichum karsti TaxID=1095194 RepID=A0A9P6IA20_9PEZI|nr:uncharacterized protein CkaCkLH20_04522 [Colletotrichum karsti]KAF9877946.1 hypothetical protein CkaCkLH20_04522 [Colletotrichum karsti]
MNHIVRAADPLRLGSSPDTPAPAQLPAHLTAPLSIRKRRRHFFQATSPDSSAFDGAYRGFLSYQAPGEASGTHKIYQLITTCQSFANHSIHPSRPNQRGAVFEYAPRPKQQQQEELKLKHHKNRVQTSHLAAIDRDKSGEPSTGKRRASSLFDRTQGHVLAIAYPPELS